MIQFLIEATVGVCLLIAAGFAVFALFERNDLLSIQNKLWSFTVANLADLTAAVDGLDTSVQALTAAAGTIGTGTDFQPIIDRINADKAAVDAVTAQIAPPA